MILNNAIAFVYAYFFSEFLCFDESLIIDCYPVGGGGGGYLISIAYCLFFSIHIAYNYMLQGFATDASKQHQSIKMQVSDTGL